MNVCDVDEIRALLGRHGFRFSKSMGQNFLIQAWVPQEIAAVSGADENTGVLEIGPGIGPLTRELSRRAGKVTAVELDKSLLPLLAETLEGCLNVNVIFQDILKLDLAALVTEEFPGLTPMVCANLPYNITSPVISRLLESRLFPVITVMIQKEVAQRICAQPGSKDCSAFSLYCQYFASCEMLFDVPPDCFLPAPKVTSTVIQLRSREAPPVEVADEALFFRTIRAGFALRRKTLVNSLGTGFSDLSKEQLTAAIQSCGLSPTVRGERLSLTDYAALSAQLGTMLKEDS
ncbi:MAG: 16S rRNA (adenine(1518)-N(6)/adenine(1519)-N(6))-dimethyltransferase RsmA [Oscillospiraceae bacterium]|nr:16S rRNA (adenine(1518)-N(6)/adenine(1519)-N(6))-dimethyltransferase RsmA [Oscillospiraceae bacterium]